MLGQLKREHHGREVVEERDGGVHVCVCGCGCGWGWLRDGSGGGGRGGWFQNTDRNKQNKNIKCAQPT